MADVQIKWGWGWLVLWGLMIPGMVFISMGRLAVGAFFVLTPLIVTGALLALFFLLSRRQAGQDRP